MTVETSGTACHGTPDRAQIRPAAAVWRPYGEETVVTVVSSSRTFLLSSKATVLWNCLVTGARPGELAARLTAVFGLEPGKARGDVDDFLAFCSAHGLVRPGEQSG